MKVLYFHQKITKKFDPSRTLSVLGKKTWPKPNQALPPSPPPLKVNGQQPKFKLD